MSVLEALFIFVATALGDAFGNLFGGGSFFVQPALLLMGIPPHFAVANDVASAGFASLFFIGSIYKNAQIKWRVVAIMAPCGALGAIYGVHLLKAIPSYALVWFIIFVCLIGIARMLAQLLQKNSQKSFDQAEDRLKIGWQIWAALSGILVGVYDGVSGAGSGMLIITALSFFVRAEYKTLAGTASAVSLCSVWSAGLTAFSSDLLDFNLLALLVPAASISGLIAAHILKKISDRKLRVTFLISALFLVFWLFFNKFIKPYDF